MPASTRRRASPLLFKWDPLSMGLDYQGNPWALSSNKVITGTFDRGGTVGTASTVDANGRRFIPGYKHPRWHHSYDATTGLWLPRGLLLEGARTNLCLRSEDFTNAAWAETNAAESDVTANATAGPDGATTADKLIASTTNNSPRAWRQTIAATDADNTFTWSLDVKAAEYTAIKLYILATTTTANQVSCVFNLSAGTAGTPANGGAGTGATAWITKLRDGWYRCSLKGDPNTPGETIGVQVNILPTSASADAFVGVVGSGVYAVAGQVEQASFPSSYIPTTTAAVTRSTDTGNFAFSAVPQAMTLYCKEVVGGNGAGTESSWNLGTGATYITVYRDTTLFYVDYVTGGVTRTATRSSAPTIGQTVETRVVLSATGTVLLGISVDAAAESASAESSATALPTAWGNTTLSLVAAGAAGAYFHTVSAFKIAAGVKTLAQMRAA